VASTAGLGGGNFASTWPNISFFYPDRMKGWALANAAGGKYRRQQCPVVDAHSDGSRPHQSLPGRTGLGVYLQNGLDWMWDLRSSSAVVGATFFMNNLTSPILVQRSGRDHQAQAYLDHVFIYIGRFDPSSATRRRFRC